MTRMMRRMRTSGLRRRRRRDKSRAEFQEVESRDGLKKNQLVGVFFL